MLEADLRDAIADANDLGHFFLLMEHMGYEISHGNRLGFRLRGQERYMVPERRDKRRLKPVADRRLFRARNRSHIVRIQNTRDSLHYTTITAICLAALKSGNIRRA